MKRLLHLLACMGLAACLSLLPVLALAASAPALGKTATPLDKNDETAVTLTIGADQTKTVSSVVFVLDKSTSIAVRDEALKMLAELKTRAGENRIRAGAVVFNKGTDARVALAGLDDAQYARLENLMRREVTSGTNIEAGLRAGIEMLQNDGASAAGDKHLVLVSDGVTYMWGNPPVSLYSEVDPDRISKFWAYPSVVGFYPIGTDTSYIASLDNMAEWLRKHSEALDNLIGSYACAYGAGDNPEKKVSYSITKDYCCLDAAVYKTALAWQTAVQNGYRCYVYASDKYTQEYPFAPRFMKGLSAIGGSSVSFSDKESNVSGMFDNVKSAILYSIAKGSVTDVIGSSFDLKDLDTIGMSVGGKALTGVVDAAKNSVSFDDGKYVVHYVSGKEEKLVWNIRTPVAAASPITLRYTLKLASKSSAPGHYKVPTNESAVLSYTGSEDETVRQSVFPKPEVSYDVAAALPPKTGDATPLVAAFGGLSASALAAAVIFHRKRRRS
ncbi:MAG: vWA domain-containing protein [Eubacteriales bacterium]|nr:vWA domain-containing protein [Eubacteriales bacterium]